MRSKTSFFNKTLYRKNLSRYWPLWALPSFGGVLIPLTMLLQMVHNDYQITVLEANRAYYSVLHMAVPVVSLLYAVLCAAAVWSYLYNSRSVGMMHRLPIRREGLFVTSFLSGMTMMLIPYVVTGGLTVLLTAVAGGLDPKAVLLTIAGVLLESFFYFASATFVAFLTGNVSAMPVLYFLLHFLKPAMDLLVGALKSGFYYGVEGGYTETLSFLCPTVHLINSIFIRQERQEVVINPETNERYRELVTVQLENFHVIVLYALAGVVLLALAYALYRRRSSERAGEVAAVGWLRPVFRYSGALLCGLGGGMVLYTLVWRPFQMYYNDLEIVPLLVCMIVMGLIGYYAVSMLLEKSLRVFRGSLPGAAAVAAVLCLICGSFHFDVFGVEHFVPEADQISMMEFRVSDNNVVLEPGRDDSLIEKTLALHQALAEDLDYVMDCRLAGEYDYNTTDDSLYLYYYLKDGRTVHRRYPIWLTWERMQQEGTFDQLLDQLANDPEMLMARLHGNQSDLQMQSLNLWDDEGRDQSLNATQTTQVYNALLEDARNRRWGRKVWFDNEETMREILRLGTNDYRADGSYDPEEIRELLRQIEELGQPFATMDLWYTEPADADDDQEVISNRLDIRLRPGMSATIDCLRKLGVLEQTSLTIIDRGDDEPVEAMPDDGSEGAMLYNPGQATTVIGLIDGQDGPTATVVTGG